MSESNLPALQQVDTKVEDPNSDEETEDTAELSPENEYIWALSWIENHLLKEDIFFHHEGEFDNPLREAVRKYHPELLNYEQLLYELTLPNPNLTEHNIPLVKLANSHITFRPKEGFVLFKNGKAEKINYQVLTAELQTNNISWPRFTHEIFSNLIHEKKQAAETLIVKLDKEITTYTQDLWKQLATEKNRKLDELDDREFYYIAINTERAINKADTQPIIKDLPPHPTVLIAAMKKDLQLLKQLYKALLSFPMQQVLKLHDDSSHFSHAQITIAAEHDIPQEKSARLMLTHWEQSKDLALHGDIRFITHLLQAKREAQSAAFLNTEDFKVEEMVMVNTFANTLLANQHLHPAAVVTTLAEQYEPTFPAIIDHPALSQEILQQITEKAKEAIKLMLDDLHQTTENWPTQTSSSDQATISRNDHFAESLMGSIDERIEKVKLMARVAKLSPIEKQNLAEQLSQIHSSNETAQAAYLEKNRAQHKIWYRIRSTFAK